MPGIYGYFGPIKYYRFGTEEVKRLLCLHELNIAVLFSGFEFQVQMWCFSFHR